MSLPISGRERFEQSPGLIALRGALRRDSKGRFLPMKRWPRHDLRTRSAGRYCAVQVYRRRDRAGTGDCVSLYLNGVETLRFDLFELAPHYHRHPSMNRVPLPGSTRAELVEEAISLMIAKAPAVVRVADWVRAELGVT